MIKGLIVDDHIIFREGLKKVLATAADIEVADETGDGREALRKIIENVYDVVLLDIVLPGMDGLDVLRAAKRGNPHSPYSFSVCFPRSNTR